MKRFRLKSIASGENAGLWISLGFTSSLKRQDVLHVVSSDQATGAGARSRRRLYVERFDQLYSCSGGCVLVRVGPKSIEVHLTPKARHLLAFETGVLLFRRERRFAGYAAAIATFRAIARVNRRVEVQGSRPGRSQAPKASGVRRGRRDPG
jgi:hypothetical protein